MSDVCRFFAIVMALSGRIALRTVAHGTLQWYFSGRFCDLDARISANRKKASGECVVSLVYFDEMASRVPCFIDVCFVGNRVISSESSRRGTVRLVLAGRRASGCFFVKNTVKIRKICPPKAKFLCKILSERARTKSVNLQNEYLCKNT